MMFLPSPPEALVEEMRDDHKGVAQAGADKDLFISSAPPSNHVSSYGCRVRHELKKKKTQLSLAQPHRALWTRWWRQVGTLEARRVTRYKLDRAPGRQIWQQHPPEQMVFEGQRINR
mmetsp:Transcript_41814/g.110728  ORF Transcript_41814/g.110728 Transcript_41814/m.110728 type:complete len:117 (+) Transcript_41814:191-541(+)